VPYGDTLHPSVHNEYNRLVVMHSSVSAHASTLYDQGLLLGDSRGAYCIGRIRKHTLPFSTEVPISTMLFTMKQVTEAKSKSENRSRKMDLSSLSRRKAVMHALKKPSLR